MAFGDITGAAAVARRLLQFADRNVDAHLLLARALLEGGDLRLAEQELKTAIGLAPGNAVAYEILGDLQRRAGNPEAAEVSLLKATTLSPKAAKPRVALAALYLESGRVDAGEQHAPGDDRERCATRRDRASFPSAAHPRRDRGG